MSLPTPEAVPESLLARLNYDPQELKFGTSGRRGLVIHLTQLEVYLNVLAELEYLQTLPREEGGIVAGEEVFFARDLRPSSSAYVEEEQGRGEMAQAVEHAILDAGMVPVNLGQIPTPALTSYAIERGRGSIMVTGSHIPFDRNGYKTNTCVGELLKYHEQPIGRAVERVRERLYREPFATSLFAADGRFKEGHRELSPETDAAALAYIERYTHFFGGTPLQGMRLVFYEHSAVGRALIPVILERLGAEVLRAGRSETFVPIDTEAIDDAQLATMQALADEQREAHGAIHAMVSTDGDSDRPLVLGVNAAGKVHFFSGDLVGMIVAQYLGADAVVVPVSCNDAIDRSRLAAVLEPKTRIGSPYVIAAMERAQQRGCSVVCGWEANGGFLTGSDIVRDNRMLAALPTRDAVLPILGVLIAARDRGLSLKELFATLPARSSFAALLRGFPRTTALRIVRRLSPVNAEIQEAVFESEGEVRLFDGRHAPLPCPEEAAAELEGIRGELSGIFTAERGFGAVVRLNYVDGVRIGFVNGDVAHLRPSGNADEFRFYAVADTPERARAIADAGVAEPDGILRTLEKRVE